MHRSHVSTCRNGPGNTVYLDALGLEKSFVESCEVQALATVFLVGDIATGADDLRLTCIAKLAHLGEKVVTSEHSVEKNLLRQDNHQINPLKRVKQKIGALNLSAALMLQWPRRRTNAHHNH